MGEARLRRAYSTQMDLFPVAVSSSTEPAPRRTMTSLLQEVAAGEAILPASGLEERREVLGDGFEDL